MRGAVGRSGALAQVPACGRRTQLDGARSAGTAYGHKPQPALGTELPARRLGVTRVTSTGQGATGLVGNQRRGKSEPRAVQLSCQ